MKKAFDTSILDSLINSPTIDTQKENEDKPIRELDQIHQAEQRAFETYKEYQKNINISCQFTNDITKGIQAGEKPELLLLKAIKCISLMAGNDLFYELNRDNIKKIYGVDVSDQASGMESITPEELDEFLNV